jgi:hypothetical protein
MSLPEFKFTNLTKPTNDTTVNSGLSAKDKMVKSGIVPNMVEKFQDTASSLKTRVSDLSSSASSALSGISSDMDGESGSSFFSFTFVIKVILIAVIVWFMWANLANNGDFHLGMGDIGGKITTFFHTMEENGRELVAKIRGTPVSKPTTKSSDSPDSDSDDDDEHKRHPPAGPAAASSHRAPVPPPMNNSSDKKPGFNNEDPKFTFLDKASREYSGPSPSADDSTSATQKHQSGKAGYCYIGEDRGFRSCARVEAGEKCMSGQIYSRQETCIDPTLRD